MAVASHALRPVALGAQLSAWSRHFEDTAAPVVAFRAAAWEGPESITAADRTWHVKACRSALEVREALALRDASQPLVILTQLGHAELGADVSARLFKRRVNEVDAWEPLLRAFGAQRLDARLAEHPWIPDVLLSGDGPYPQAASGTLDAATAWRFVLTRLLGVSADVVDLSALLEWTLSAPVLARWAALPTEHGAALAKWLRASVGAAADLPLALVANGHGAGTVAVGLVCAALFDGDSEPTGVRGAAAIRLERWTGGLRLDPHQVRSLVAASERLVQRGAGDGSSIDVPTVLARADELLRSLGAETEAWRSRWLPSGFSLRLQRFASDLVAALDSNTPGEALAQAAAALAAIRDHARANAEPQRVARAEQALRLARYLRTVDHDVEPHSFLEAVAMYHTQHAFADTARYALYASEPHEALGAALVMVADRVTAAREAFTQAFARLATTWFESPAGAPGVTLIEDVIPTTVAPLAQAMPVLLVVADGMSVAVSDTLGPSLESRGWTMVDEPTALTPASVVAALPSVTEVCRTSLFVGALRRGVASDERSGFASQPTLVRLSAPKKPPVLFHKSYLGAAASLDPEIASAIADPQQRVVAVVVNAVDDHLLKDDMVRPEWTADYVPVIAALSDAARVAGRCLVLTSDHGHVLDRQGTEKLPGDSSDRYRQTGAAPRPGEVVATGPRVLTDSGRVVVAASERIRYMSRKNGYHGGISPQEVVIPLLMFAPDGAVPDGYQEVSRPRPTWWDLDAQVVEAAAPVAPAPTKTGLPLFDQPPAPIVVVAAGPEPAWLARLFASDVFKEQKQRAARAALDEARLRVLLVALSGRGGRMTTVAVAERLAMPVGRVSSVIAAASQVLNFDGYQVLFLQSDEVVLDEPLLMMQFELGA